MVGVIKLVCTWPLSAAPWEALKKWVLWKHETLSLGPSAYISGRCSWRLVEPQR